MAIIRFSTSYTFTSIETLRWGETLVLHKIKYATALNLQGVIKSNQTNIIFWITIAN